MAYIETVLRIIAEKCETSTTVSILEVEQEAKARKESARRNQLLSAMQNYKKLELLEYDFRKDPGHYILYPDKISHFLTLYEEGKVRLWWSKNGQEIAPQTPINAPDADPGPKEPEAEPAQEAKEPEAEPAQEAKEPEKKPAQAKAPKRSKIPSPLIVRAILAGYPGKHSLLGLEKIARENGHIIKDSAFKNIGRIKFIAKQHERNVRPRAYRLISTTPKFFIYYYKEMADYCRILPKRENEILAAFESAENALTSGTEQDLSSVAETVSGQSESAEPATLDNAETATPGEDAADADPGPADIQQTKNFRPIHVIRGILSAYSKPMTGRQIKNIADKYDLKLSNASIGWYRYNKADEVRIIGMFGNAKTFVASDEFFSINANSVSIFLKMFPSKARIILKRFNEFVPDQVAQYREIYESIEPAESAEPAKVESNGSAEFLADQEDSNEMIDAANVGAAILSYIHKLKKKLREKVETETAPEVATLKTTIQSQSADLARVKSELSDAEFQNEKLKSIIKNQDDKIRDLSHKLSVLQNQRTPENKVIPTKFPVRDVARITRLVKNGRN